MAFHLVALAHHVFVDQRLEQAVLHRGVVRHRVGGLVVAVGRQHLELGLVQGLLRGLDLGHPRVEAGAVGGMRGEAHLREAVAAVVRRQAEHLARLVGDQVQLGLHAGHRVDLRAQVRDEERVHHRVGGDLEVQRRVDRERDLVDRGNALLRVDEHPLPVQRHRLDGDRLDLGIQRLVRIQRMRGAPGQHRQDQDDHARDRPHHHLDRGGVRPVRLVAGLGVGRAVAPGEGQGHHDDRDHHQQHQHHRGDQQRLLVVADLTLGVEDGRVAAGQQQRGQQQQTGAQRAPELFQRNHRTIQLRRGCEPRGGEQEGAESPSTFAAPSWPACAIDSAFYAAPRQLRKPLTKSQRAQAPVFACDTLPHPPTTSPNRGLATI